MKEVISFSEVPRVGSNLKAGVLIRGGGARRSTDREKAP